MTTRTKQYQFDPEMISKVVTVEVIEGEKTVYQATGVLSGYLDTANGHTFIQLPGIDPNRELAHAGQHFCVWWNK